MGMARGALRPCYSPTRRLRPFTSVHSPAFPVVADGAKDVVAAPVIIPPRGDQATARQWPPASPRDHAGQRMATQEWLPRSRTRQTGVGVDTGVPAVVEEPVISRRNAC